MDALRAAVADLLAAYPREKIPPETGALYLRKLADLPPGVAAAAVAELIETSEWFPTIAAIRRLAAERLTALPGENEALAQIAARAAWRRSDGTEAPALTPAVGEALRLVGGVSALRSTDRPEVLRSQFLRGYRELRESRVRELQISSPRQPIAEVSCQS